MWTRIYRLKAKRNLSQLHNILDALAGEVGWLQGEHVVLASESSRLNQVQIRFFRHKDWCDCDLSQNPDRPIKQRLKWIMRHCR